MTNAVCFMHRIKHDSSKEGSAAWDKGIEVHTGATENEAKESALQSYHAYLGAYAYGHSDGIDYVSCSVTDVYGMNIAPYEVWSKPNSPEPQE